MAAPSLLTGAAPPDWRRNHPTGFISPARKAITCRERALDSGVPNPSARDHDSLGLCSAMAAAASGQPATTTDNPGLVPAPVVVAPRFMRTPHDVMDRRAGIAGPQGGNVANHVRPSWSSRIRSCARGCEGGRLHNTLGRVVISLPEISLIDEEGLGGR
jgi:hypothetical protein